MSTHTRRTRVQGGWCAHTVCPRTPRLRGQGRRPAQLVGHGPLAVPGHPSGHRGATPPGAALPTAAWGGALAGGLHGTCAGAGGAGGPRTGTARGRCCCCCCSTCPHPTWGQGRRVHDALGMPPHTKLPVPRCLMQHQVPGSHDGAGEGSARVKGHGGRVLHVVQRARARFRVRGQANRGQASETRPCPCPCNTPSTHAGGEHSNTTRACSCTATACSPTTRGTT